MTHDLPDLNPGKWQVERYKNKSAVGRRLSEERVPTGMGETAKKGPNCELPKMSLGAFLFCKERENIRSIRWYWSILYSLDGFVG
jgi:hypothetical protein